MRRLTATLLVVFFATLSAAADALADKRVALVIGNSTYTSTKPLKNPANDATDMSDLLKDQLGFDVMLRLDVDKDKFEESLGEFAEKAAGADVAFVYYAGHGVEVDKHNYLMPVNIELKSDRTIRFQAVTLDDILASVDGAKLKIVVLDACRDNPFAAVTRSAGRGLVRVSEGSLSEGTLISYSAKEGTTAQDGAGRNSPFAVALKKHLSEPGIELLRVFRNVAADVSEATGKKQEPFFYGSLPREDVILKVAAATPAVTSDATPRSNDDSLKRLEELSYWGAIKDENEPALFETFIEKFPDGVFAPLAKLKLDQLKGDPAIAAAEADRQKQLEADRERLAAEARRRDEELARQRLAAEQAKREEEDALLRRQTEERKRIEDELAGQRAEEDNRQRLAAEEKLRQEEAQKAAERQRIAEEFALAQRNVISKEAASIREIYPLGVRTKDGEGRSVVLLTVSLDSVLAENSVRVGDRLARINGKPVGTGDDLIDRLHALIWNRQNLTLEFVRPDDRAYLVKLPFALLSGSGPQVAGLGVPIEGLGAYVREIEDGLLVTEVKDGGSADEAGFIAGDIISEADGRAIRDAVRLDNMFSNPKAKRVTLAVVSVAEPNSVDVRKVAVAKAQPEPQKVVEPTIQKAPEPQAKPQKTRNNAKVRAVEEPRVKEKARPAKKQASTKRRQQVVEEAPPPRKAKKQRRRVAEPRFEEDFRDERPPVRVRVRPGRGGGGGIGISPGGGVNILFGLGG